jgi:ABC-type transport system substrate-binding protein
MSAFQRQFGRRRFLASAGLAATGAASLALVGCGDDDDGGDGGTASAPTDDTPTTDTSPSTATGLSGKPGGVIFADFNVRIIDHFDPNRATFGPAQFVFATTMSRLLYYTDPESEVLAGDVAEGVPEQPDELTFVFKLRDGVTWHDKPPVNGRALTADDVAFYVERQKAGLDRDGVEDPRYYNRSSMSVIDAVEVVDARTVRFRLARPDATLLDLVAGPFNFLVAREAFETFSNKEWIAADARTVIGTGPFVLDDVQIGEFARFSRHPGYFESGLPYADGIRFLSREVEEGGGEASFRLKAIDWWQPGTFAEAEALRAEMPELELQEFGFPNSILTTFATQSPPWNDSRLLQAVNRAFDRQHLIDELHEGRGQPNGLVSWVSRSWALPEQELATLPGYLADKAEDFAEARLLWEAAGGPGELEIAVADLFAAVFPRTEEVVTAQLSAALGIPVTSRIVSYTDIDQGQLARTLSLWLGWGNPFYSADPSAQLAQAFHSQGSLNFWGTNQPGGLVVEGLDAQLDKLVASYDTDERRQIVLDLHRRSVEVGTFGVMDFYTYMAQRLSWPYLRNMRASSYFFGHDIKNQWLDQDDPSFQGRPA